ncbi:MAG TPA: FAD-dependent oxidoreductase [Symbiobacteriaceae bacterium]|nr:FAD-dependent oxidoreductase [Symbiobacteriaceae bacterium]
MHKTYDVIVAGGGPAGLCAAVAAARNGARVLLVERYGFLGGNATASLVGPWMTFHSSPEVQVVEGLPEEIVRRLREIGGTLGHVRDTTGYVPTVTPFDAEALKFVAMELCAEAGVELLLHSVVTGVVSEGDALQGIVVHNKSGRMELDARVVIDATGDGDVAVLAGAEFQQGRREDGLTQPLTLMFKLGNVDLSAVRAYMKANPEDFYRRTVWESVDSQPHLSVNGFYSKLAEAMQAGELNLQRDMVLFFQTVHPDEVTVNMTRVQGLDATDAWQLTRAEVELRRQVMELVRFFRSRIPGFAGARLISTGVQAGVRESRRIMGDYLLTGEDILSGRHFDDVAARFAYPIDIHDPAGSSTRTIRPRCGSYEIPLRTMLPRGLRGLMVAGRCISCTHEALAAIRLMPSAMALGQAAGTAAAMAVAGGVDVRAVDMAALRQRLMAQGANLAHAAAVAPGAEGDEEMSGSAAAGKRENGSVRGL